MISFIVKNSSATKVINRILNENANNFEVIFVDTWAEGIAQSEQDYVCLTNKIFMISSKYSKKLLKPFTVHYRKLAMVSPAIGLESWNQKIFGYKLEDGLVTPLVQPSSLQPYLVQIGPITGAVIRRSALKDFQFTEDEILDSINLSLHLWSTGQRVILNPEAVYYSFTWENQEIPDEIELPDNMEEVEQLFSHELIA